MGEVAKATSRTCIDENEKNGITSNRRGGCLFSVGVGDRDDGHRASIPGCKYSSQATMLRDSAASLYAPSRASLSDLWPIVIIKHLAYLTHRLESPCKYRVQISGSQQVNSARPRQILGIELMPSHAGKRGLSGGSRRRLWQARVTWPSIHPP